MTDDPVAQAARSTAAILAAELGPALPAQVEAALAARGTAGDTGQGPDQYLDPVSLASLIVSVASLAWTVYNDHRKRTSDPRPDAIAREVRITLREQDIVLPAGTERITEIVAAEITRNAASAGPE